MIGAMFGLVLSLVGTILTDGSWWFVLIGTVVGGLMELAVRLGAGEEFGDALGNAVSLGIALAARLGLLPSF